MTAAPHELLYVPPGRAGISETALHRLLDRIEQEQIQFHSLMILRHGVVGAACWWKPYGPDLPHHLYSFSKSVVSLAVGIAIEEGLFSLDNLVADFFPEKISAKADSRIYELTVRHLLIMSSGVQFNEIFVVTEGDWVEKFLNAPFAFSPGEKFHYNSMNTHILSAIIQKTAGQGLAAYLKPRLFEPLGIREVQWDCSPDGIEAGGWGLYLRTEDLAKIALLCLQKGVYQGRQLVPAGWIADVSSIQIDNQTTALGTVESRHNTAGYGYHFWICPTTGVYRADGAFGQYAVIWPEKDLAVVATSGQGPQDAVLDAIWDTLITPLKLEDGAGEWQVLPNAGWDPALAQRMASCSLLQPTHLSSHSELEKNVSGRKYTLRRNIDSVLPLMLRALDRVFLIGIRHFSLTFGAHGCILDWREGAYLNSVPVSLDHSILQTFINIGGHNYRVACAGGWEEEQVFLVRIFFLNTPHTRILRFRFLAGGNGVSLLWEEAPSLKNSLAFVLDMKMAAVPFQNRVLHFTDKMVLPVLGIATGNTKNEQNGNVNRKENQ